MFILYTKQNCPQCDIAKKLLSDVNEKVIFIELDTGQKKDASSDAIYITREDLINKVPNARTMPQIFFYDTESNVEKYIGGTQDLRNYLNKL